MERELETLPLAFLATAAEDSSVASQPFIYYEYSSFLLQKLAWASYGPWQPRQQKGHSEQQSATFAQCGFTALGI